MRAGRSSGTTARRAMSPCTRIAACSRIFAIRRCSRRRKAFAAVVLGGALQANGMASFKGRLSADEVESVRAYLIERANQAKNAPHGAAALTRSSLGREAQLVACQLPWQFADKPVDVSPAMHGREPQRERRGQHRGHRSLGASQVLLAGELGGGERHGPDTAEHEARRRCRSRANPARASDPDTSEGRLHRRSGAREALCNRGRPMASLSARNRECRQHGGRREAEELPGLRFAEAESPIRSTPPRSHGDFDRRATCQPPMPA